MTYHAESHLIARAVGSVLAQTCTDFELLILADTPVPEFPQDPRVRVIETPDVGVYGKWNIGIQHAEGEFIAFLPADDLWLSEKLEKSLRGIGEAGALVHQTLHVNEELEPFQNYRCETIEQVRPRTRAEWHARFAVGNPIFCCTAVYRRSLHADIGGFDEALPNMADLDFYIRVNLHSGIAVVPEILSMDRITEGNRSLSELTSAQDMAVIRERHFAC